MRHAYIDKYSYINSPIHQLKSSIKIVFTLLSLLYLLALPMSWALWGYGLYFLFFLILIYLSNVPLSFILKRSAIILPFLAFIIVLNTFLKEGDIGVALLVLARSILSIMTLILFVSTTKFYFILQTLSKWGAPPILMTLLSFMYRYFFVLVDEMHKMVRGVRARSCENGTFKTIRIFSHIIGTLFIRSYERAERVYHAMVMQGFEGEIKNT